MDNRSKLINPFIIVRPDYCCKCNTPHVLEIYNDYNKPIGFSALVNYKKNIADASKISLAYGKCRKCGARYLLQWDNDGYVTLIDNPILVKNFLGNFKDFEIGDQEDAYNDAETQGISWNK